MISKLCLAGEFAHDRLGASWERALQALDREVVRFDIGAERRRLGWPLRNRYAHRVTIASYRIRQSAAREYNEELYRRAVNGGAEVLLLHNGEFVFPDVLARIRRRGIRVVIFHADNPLPPHYANRPETLAAAREADLYLVWSEQLAARLRQLGVRRACFFPFAWDPMVFPWEPPPPHQWEGVAFVGGWDPERERILETVAARFPLKIYGPPYWGTRTRRASAARKLWMGEALAGVEAARVARESAVSLNILRTQHYVDGVADGLIMRHFEIPGAGGFLLSTRSGGATEFFAERVAGAYFGNDDEMLEQIATHLKDPPRRCAIARRAHEVTTRHTYADRLRALLSALEAQTGDGPIVLGHVRSPSPNADEPTEAHTLRPPWRAAHRISHYSKPGFRFNSAFGNA